MLGFPSYWFSAFIFSFAVIGVIAVVHGIYFGIKGVDDKTLEDENARGKEAFRNVMTIIVGIIFIFVGTFFSIENFWSVYNFRNIDISRVKRLKVIKSDGEYKPDNPRSVYYENAESIQNALTTLKNCSSSSRNHETYGDGYKLQIIFDDESLGQDFYLSVYRKSNDKSGKTVVIPHYYQSKNLNLGEFSCPDFQDWVRDNIDPLFQNK